MPLLKESLSSNKMLTNILFLHKMGPHYKELYSEIYKEDGDHGWSGHAQEAELNSAIPQRQQ